MKNSINKLFVLLAIVMSFVAVQSVSAAGAKDCDVQVDGPITAIVSNGAITVNDDILGETTVYGIPLTYLANQLTTYLIPGVVVAIDAIYKYEHDRFEACTIWVDGLGEVLLPGVRGLEE